MSLASIGRAQDEAMTWVTVVVGAVVTITQCEVTSSCARSNERRDGDENSNECASDGLQETKRTRYKKLKS
jgi:hypothetical protein